MVRKTVTDIDMQRMLTLRGIPIVCSSKLGCVRGTPHVPVLLLGLESLAPSTAIRDHPVGLGSVIRSPALDGSDSISLWCQNVGCGVNTMVREND